MIDRHSPADYIGVDIVEGPGVDTICDIGELVERFGPERFDLVVCTEVLEHVRDWRTGLSNLKRVLASGGTLLVTTRSIGFHYHGYPQDFWRYEPDDIRTLMSDMSLEVLESDGSSPGVFFVATKPSEFNETDISEHELFSIVTGHRCRQVTDAQVRWFLGLKRPVGRFFRKLYRSLRKRLPEPR